MKISILLVGNEVMAAGFTLRLLAYKEAANVKLDHLSRLSASTPVDQKIWHRKNEKGLYRKGYRVMFSGISLYENCYDSGQQKGHSPNSFVPRRQN